MRLAVYRRDGSLRVTVFVDSATGRLAEPVPVSAGETAILRDIPGRLAAVPQPIPEGLTIYDARLTGLLSPGFLHPIGD